MKPPFEDLSLAQKQAAVNAVLIPAARRLPKRFRTRPKIMGPLVAYVWEAFKSGQTPTQADLLRRAKALEAGLFEADELNIRD